MPLESREKALEIARLALDRKARELAVLDMAGLVMYTDFFVICSGQSTQQVKAIAERIEEGLKQRGIRPQGVEGRAFAHWVLIDYGDVIVHVFEEETREFYELDKLWLDAPRVGVHEGKDSVGRKDQGRILGGRS